MKRFNFLSVVIAGILMVAAVGCTTLTESQDDYYNEGSRASSNRVYVDDPYRGVVVLERDPWTGRYYEVSPYGAYSNRNYRNYGYGSRYYGRGNSGYNNGRVYNRNSQPQQRTPEQRRQNEENKKSARGKVLGQ